MHQMFRKETYKVITNRSVLLDGNIFYFAIIRYLQHAIEACVTNCNCEHFIWYIKVVFNFYYKLDIFTEYLVML